MAGVGARAVGVDYLGGAVAFHRGALPLTNAMDWGPGTQGAGGINSPSSLSFYLLLTCWRIPSADHYWGPEQGPADAVC